MLRYHEHQHFDHHPHVQSGKRRSRTGWQNTAPSSTRLLHSEHTGKHSCIGHQANTSVHSAFYLALVKSAFGSFFLKEIPINCSVGRLALAEATPPCIPYIGLVLQVGMTYVLQDVFCILYFVHPYSKNSPTSVPIDLHISVFQDLTFVQIGNPDLIDGKINFAKRWQQFNILVRRSIFSTECSIV